jgi:hypothetical protein
MASPPQKKVAFAGTLDPVLELLRQLAYDYRFGTRLLRLDVEKKMGDTAALKLLSAPGGEGVAGTSMSGPPSVGLQGDCPQ